MGLFGASLLKVIEWTDASSDQIVYKYEYNIKKNFIAKGSALTVRDSQVAIFADKGRMADVFEPGYYKLDTDNIPVLTKLLSWKYGFESPFKSDIYFVNTKQFTKNKWGTKNPIIIRDADFGSVRVRCFGTFAFKVKDAFSFMKELSGTNSSFKTDDIVEFLKSTLIMHVSDAISESKVPVLDMAGNLIELSRVVLSSIAPAFDEIGVEITAFNLENFSMPDELEKALDERTKLGMMRGNMDVYMQMAQADALKEAAKNPGTAGGMMGAGIGMGMGMGMGKTFSQMADTTAQQPKETVKVKCSNCGATVKEGVKFCPECGKPMGNVCPKCGKVVADGAKFCPECGASMKKTCPKCGAELSPNAKFCPECGEKID
jgi:membrane protease subunit (stomatin/prohibitin family)